MAAGAARWGVWTKCLKLARGLFLQLGIPPLSWSPGVCMPPPLLLILRYCVKTGVRRIIDLTGLLPIKMWILVWSRAITREVAATSHHSEYCNQCLEHWPCIIRTPPRSEHTLKKKREVALDLEWYNQFYSMENETVQFLMYREPACLEMSQVYQRPRPVLCPAQRGPASTAHNTEIRREILQMSISKDSRLSDAFKTKLSIHKKVHGDH